MRNSIIAKSAKKSTKPAIYTPQLDLGHELIIDNFAGGGGASEGIEQAFGRAVDIAINHDGEALAMHEANHPTTNHYREDVFDIHPGFVTGQQPIGLAWFSPDCKHHSKAKGGKPREKKIRGLAWVTLKWAAFQMPRCIGLENVEEFRDWGPLDAEGKPIKAEKGRTFNAFIAALSTGLSKDHPDVQEIYDALGADFPMGRLYAGLGYKVEHRILRACDYGTPTIRKRLFVFARRDGLPIVWPTPTHADPKSAVFKSGKLKPWRTAAECIDWSIPCPSIFERSKPLADATLRRIAKGIMKFVVNSSDPFIVKFSENSIGTKTDEPLHTVMAGAPRFGLITPHITKFRSGSIGTAIDEPMHTLTAGGDSNPDHQSTGNVMGIVEATIAPIITEHANASTQRNFSANEPLRTQCAEVKGGHFAAVSATLIQTGYGERKDQAPRVPGIDKPLGTIVASGGKHALVSAMLAKHFGGVVGTSVEVPFGTVTTVDHHSVVTANLVRQFGNSDAADVDSPVGTITAGGSGKTQLVTSNLVKLRGDNIGQPTDAPLATVSAGGLHHAEVRAFLIKYYGNEKDGFLPTEPMHTIPTKDRIGLVTIKGEDYAIIDIGMRMLTPRELARAQGFPDSYILDPFYTKTTARGKQITMRLSKTSQVRMIGNSVCPPLAKALIEANFKHEQELARVA